VEWTFLLKDYVDSRQEGKVAFRLVYKINQGTTLLYD